MKTDNNALYTLNFFLALGLNFVAGLIFTNNAIYPIFVEYQGGNAAQLGIFMSIYGISAVLSRPLVGMLIDRYTVTPVLGLGILLMGLTPLGFYTTLGDGLNVMVWILRVFQGFGFGLYFSAFFTLAASAGPPSRRTETVAMYGITGLGSNLVGPFMGEQLVRIWGLEAFFAAIVCASILALVIVSQLKTGHQPDSNRMGLGAFRQILKEKSFYFPLILAMLLAISFATPSSFLAPLARSRGITGFGLFFTGYAMAGITVRLIGKKWADRFGWRRILVPMFVLYAFGLLTIYFSYTVPGLILAGIFTGSAHGLAFPAVTSLGYTMAPDRGKGTAMAMVTGMMDLGSFLAGFVFGFVAYFLDFGSVFIFAIIAPLSAILLLLGHMVRHPEHYSNRPIS